MALVDFMGPIIGSFLQGRQLRNDEEQRVKQNARADEENRRQNEELKLRQEQEKRRAQLEQEQLTLAKQAHKVDTLRNLSQLSATGAIDAPTETVPNNIGGMTQMLNPTKTVYAPGAKFADVDLSGISTPQQQQAVRLGGQAQQQDLAFSDWARKKAITTGEAEQQQKAQFAHQATMQDKQIKLQDARIAANQAFQSKEHELSRKASRDLAILNAGLDRSNAVYKLNLQEAVQNKKFEDVRANMVPLAASGEMTQEEVNQTIPIEERGKFRRDMAKAGYNIVTRKEQESLGAIGQIEQYKQLAKRAVDAAKSGKYIEAAAIRDESETLLASIGRILGERGVISDRDINRYRNLFPVTIKGELGIDPNVTDRRLEELNNIQTSHFERMFPASQFTEKTRQNMRKAAGIPEKKYTIVPEGETKAPAATPAASKQSTGHSESLIDSFIKRLNSPYKAPHF